MKTRARGIKWLTPCASHSQMCGVATLKSKRMVLGAGSNVVDIFFPMRMLPKPGDKTYFASESASSDTVVGGVTLNHLSWARALGVPTGLLAFQGNDANGKLIRTTMSKLGVDSEFVRVRSAYSTSVSHILSGPDGERTILMAPASTSRLTGDVMHEEYSTAVAHHASMVTTEISQLPLSGVEFLLDAAATHKIPSLLDVDVTPSVATGPARLGDIDELRRCVRKAGVLKLTASAAGELLALVSNVPLESRLENIAQQLADAFGSQLCVVTDGSRGSALALGRLEHSSQRRAQLCEAVLVPIYSGVTQKDATGAGDAFFGGIVAAVYHHGMPTTSSALITAGSVAAAAGAACVEVIGALPVEGVSAPRIAALCPAAKSYVAAARALDALTSSHGENAATAASASSTGGLDAAWLSSLRDDVDALVGCVAQYASVNTASDSSLAALMDAVRTNKLDPPVVYCSGIGKSGAVASRLAMSLRSIGVRTQYIHGSEWVHGDLGGTRSGDVAILFSHSGKTPELVDVAARLRAKNVAVWAVSSSGESALASASSHHFAAPARDTLLGGVPTRSIVVQEAIANAIVSSFTEALQVTKTDFKANHPGGALGAAKVL